MCGLFGYYSLKVSEDQGTLRSRFLSTQHALHHRGPDDTGLDTFVIPRDNDLPPGSLSLGHTRLSIIDLSSAGHQPMYSGDGRYTIIFNGEIYNYRELRTELKKIGYIFRTKSDTEVLLAVWERWGVSGLRRLKGMFAFVVFDREDQSLTLVRDAFGIKPLFYSLDQISIYFASEIPALLKLLPSKPNLDLQQAYDYLVYGHYDNQECTFYNNIKHLLPGHWLRINLKTMHVAAHERWWWPSIKERTDLSFEDAAAQLREMFLNNVRLHLRSDVPVGAALSGGIDSSAVVCAMRNLKPDMPIHTFTYVASGSTVDEEAWADIVNTKVGAVSHKTEVKSKELGNDINDLIRTQGEPFGSTSIYAQYCIFKEAHKYKIKVTLDGQGADELLAGYSGYPSDAVHSLLDQNQYFSAFKFLIRWANWPGRSYLDAFVMLMRVLTPNFLISLAYRIMGRSPTPSWLNIKYLSKKGIRLSPPKRRKSPPDAHGRRLADALRHSLTGYGLTSLLRHGDRNSMRWSIESRVPFLTTDIAEFLLQLPESYLLSPDGETKHIFRAAMQGIVPDKILNRRDKIGFQTPEQEWLLDQRMEIDRWLSVLDELPFLNATKSRNVVKKILSGKTTFSTEVWRKINFCRWAKLNSSI
jgi:asparagine synthase (glutamine-hydrolysing)